MPRESQFERNWANIHHSELDRVAVRIRRHAGTHLESVVRGELYRCAELDSSSFDQLRVQNRRSLKQACTALH